MRTRERFLSARAAPSSCLISHRINRPRGALQASRVPCSGFSCCALCRCLPGLYPEFPEASQLQVAALREEVRSFGGALLSEFYREVLVEQNKTEIQTQLPWVPSRDAGMKRVLMGRACPCWDGGRALFSVCCLLH
ncbi:UNVERIFIED_CONTAM: hypothetical protein FKN15_033643 [Acipenser sinensis]